MTGMCCVVKKTITEWLQFVVVKKVRLACAKNIGFLMVKLLKLSGYDEEEGEKEEDWWLLDQMRRTSNLVKTT
jgi:hypothetical protein